MTKGRCGGNGKALNDVIARRVVRREFSDRSEYNFIDDLTSNTIQLKDINNEAWDKPVHGCFWI